MDQREIQKQEDRIAALEKGQDKILSLLEPISDTYRTVSLLGKWMTALLVFVSICIGIVWSYLHLKN